MKHIQKKLIFAVFFISSYIVSYDLPLVNLGATSFLDGGPLRSKPGWYYQQYIQTYHSHTLRDNDGTLLGNIPSPTFHAIAAIPQTIYVMPWEILWANPGFDITMPIELYSSIEKNSLGIRTKSGGLGDLLAGIFLQFRALFKNTQTNTLFLSPTQPLHATDLLWGIQQREAGIIKPIFVHRLEFVISFPTGRYSSEPRTFSPGNGFLFIDPYWAFTLFFTQRLSTSWHIHYLWCAQNEKSKQAGTAIHGTYTLEYALNRNIYLGINGYFLQQLTDTKINGTSIKNAKEQLIAIGPGMLYAFGKKLEHVVFANFFQEIYARNRPQGFKMNFRFLKYF